MTRRASSTWLGWLVTARHHGLLEDERVLNYDLTTVSRAEWVSGTRVMGWVREKDVVDVRRTHAALESSSTNVVLRVLPEDVPAPAKVPRLVLAADLLDEPDARSRELGIALLSRMRLADRASDVRA